MKTVLIALMYVLGLAELLLAYYFFKTNSHSPVRRVMVLLALVTGSWVMVTTMTLYNESTSMLVLYRVAHVLGLFIVTLLLHFSLLFPFPQVKFDRLHYIFMYSMPIVLSLVTLYSDLFLYSFIASSTDAGQWVGGAMYWLYCGYLLVMYSVATAVLIKKLPIVDGIHRRNLKVVLLSIIFGGFPAVIVDVVIPLLTNEGRYAWFGSSSTVIWLGLTSYTILRKD